KVREAANRVKCANHLKQLALACHMYHDSRGYLPRNQVQPHPTDMYRNLNNKGSWLVHLLPFVEGDNLHRQIGDLDINQAETAGILPQPVSFLRCPSDRYDPETPITNYAGNHGPQCWVGPCGWNPYQKYCIGTANWPPEPNPGTLDPLTYPGYSASPNWGYTVNPSQVRGMFGRFGPKIRLRDAADGTTNTLLLGETLPDQRHGQ